jgi:hypothetical protein
MKINAIYDNKNPVGNLLNRMNNDKANKRVEGFENMIRSIFELNDGSIKKR